LYILYGEDDYSLNQSLDEIKRKAGDSSLLAANTTSLDGQQVTLSQLGEVCDTLPFLGGKRLVIVRGLLGRFEPRVRPRGKKNRRVPDSISESEQMADRLGRAPDSTIVVLIDGKIGSRNPLLRGLTGKADVKYFPPLKGARLRQWIQQRVSEEGGVISARAADLLAMMVGSDLWTMANEVSKLVDFTSGRQIEEEDVRKVVSNIQQASVFTLIDAVLESKVGVAEASLQRLLDQGAAPVYILAMLSRQVQMVFRAKELKTRGKSRADIQNALGVTSEFAFQKTMEQAEKSSLKRLKGLYHQLLDADLAIKTGRYRDALALNLLAAESASGAGM
jgi:DNA polymerase-3 subunit delta